MIVGKKRNTLTRRFVFWFPRVVFLLFILFPFYWTLATAVKPESVVLRLPLDYVPWPPIFDSFINVWTNLGFERFFYSSVQLAGGVLLVVTTTAILAGYAMARFRFRGMFAVLILFLVTQMFPAILFLVPLVFITKFLGIFNTIWAAIWPQAAHTTPFCTVMMIGFYRGVPRELEEAAMIDGCNRFTALFRVILPAVLPGIVATAIFAFIDAWNAFLVPFVLINDDNHWPLTVGLNRLLSEYEILWSGICAGSVLALIPAFIFFAYIQKYLIRGLAGAVKG